MSCLTGSKKHLLKQVYIRIHIIIHNYLLNGWYTCHLRKIISFIITMKKESTEDTLNMLAIILENKNG